MSSPIQPQEEFILRPWEFDSNPSPHARINFKFDGQQHHFSLKARDGMIYFRETGTQPVFAILRRFKEFENIEAIEPSVLKAAWVEEVSRENFGRYIESYYDFPRLPASTVLCQIRRSDHSGWIKEWFDSDWVEVGPKRNKPALNIYQRLLKKGNLPVEHDSNDYFLKRAFVPEEYHQVKPHWIKGNIGGLIPLLKAILQLWAPEASQYYKDRLEEYIPLQLFSLSPLGEGSIGEPNSEFALPFGFSPAAVHMLELLEKHFVFCGVSWRNSLTNSHDFTEYLHLQQPHIEAEIERWGENWRGLWYMEPTTIDLPIEFFPPPTSHERLEATLLVRDWLEKIISPQKVQKLLGTTGTGF